MHTIFAWLFEALVWELYWVSRYCKRADCKTTALAWPTQHCCCHID